VTISSTPLLRKVDAVTFNVPDLDAGLRSYVNELGHQLSWRNDEIGQAAVGLPDADTEIVLTTSHRYEPNWLVESAADAADAIERAGGAKLSPVSDIPVGRVAVVADRFGNVLVLVDLSKGRYITNSEGEVTDVTRAWPPECSARCGHDPVARDLGLYLETLRSRTIDSSGPC
jgi:catechol 2,3-dioxygenase-like lactoylglutathione lyase family enzyme